MPGLSFPIVAFVVSATLFAPLASWLALQRARPWAIWFLFGVALGPVASLLLILGPPGRCPACDTRTVGWPRSCLTCGLIFSSEGSETVRFASRPRLPAAAATVASVGPAGLAPVARSTRAARGAVPAPQLAGAPLRRDSATPVHATIAGGADPGAENPGRRSAMGLGRRPSAGSPASRFAAQPEPSPAHESASLGSGVFIGGSESLQIGSRYLLARVGSELHVLGPVHLDPAAIAVRVPLGSVQPTIVADRLFIAPASSRHGPELAFGAVLLERGIDLGHELQEAGRSWSPPA